MHRNRNLIPRAGDSARGYAENVLREKRVHIVFNKETHIVDKVLCFYLSFSLRLLIVLLPECYYKLAS
jgi:hypothetical protein